MQSHQRFTEFRSFKMAEYLFVGLIKFKSLAFAKDFDFSRTSFLACSVGWRFIDLPTLVYMGQIMYH